MAAGTAGHNTGDRQEVDDSLGALVAGQVDSQAAGSGKAGVVGPIRISLNQCTKRVYIHSEGSGVVGADMADPVVAPPIVLEAGKVKVQEDIVPGD